MGCMNDARRDPKPDHHYHFVTGKLAAEALRDIASQLADRYGFSYTVGVLPITVAALMTPKFLRRHLDVPDTATHVVLPGFLRQQRHADDQQESAWLDDLSRQSGATILIGPTDCRELPEWFGGTRVPPDLSTFDIEIIAEINHVPRRSVDEFVRQANRLVGDGADRIDIGCDPSNTCSRIADYVVAAKDLGLKISIDTFDVGEAAAATAAGADLVLSVNASNRHACPDWGCEVVAIPDTPDDSAGLDRTVAYLNDHGVAFRLDAILEPIGSGLFASLQRYARVRAAYPDAPMMMGIGNVTELTDVDSAGLNFLLLAICQELRIESVLTTQVINWARSSVRECDVARRLVRHAITRRIPPKRLSDDLVMLRDAKLRPYPADMFDQLSETIRDNNYRLFAQDQTLHLVSAGLHLSDDDPFRLFEALLARPQSDNVDASHAFYLGYELAKATLALQLGKQYEQDRALDWGILTVAEDLHRIARTSRHRPGNPAAE